MAQNHMVAFLFSIFGGLESEYLEQCKDTPKAREKKMNGEGTVLILFRVYD